MHLLFVWFMFELGQAISIALKLDGVVRDKSNKAASRWGIFLDRLPVFAWRVFFVTCLFGLFFTGAAPAILKVIGMSEDNRTILILTELSLIMNTVAAPFLAGLIGVSFDFIISKIPALASYVPSVDTQTIEIKETHVDQSGNLQSVTQKTEVTTAPPASGN